MSFSASTMCRYTALAILLLLPVTPVYAQDEPQASCPSAGTPPSAKEFYRFIKKFKAEDLKRNETLLQSSVEQLNCQQVFKLKLVNRTGDISHRYYDTRSFELVLDDSHQQLDPLDRVFRQLDKLVGDEAADKDKTSQKEQ
ncbi:hypothetical protein KJY73_17750 [Bowmanella sp. Y26]|uniref:hypothetical protein n=1 Tax=Bowmanella yangjiangensis TaxID=2811230 RepID=UPI001BDD66CA|nr:hypothetical protein [Bowmanella yangjiangensis]MBT1065436.1 hypothetical protein [Bowmanella yangjiangensis]